LPDTEIFAPRDEARAFRRRLATAVLLLVAATAAVSAGVYSFLHDVVPPENQKIETVAATVSPPPAAAARPVASVSTTVPPPADPVPVSAAELVLPKVVVSQPLDRRGIVELQTKLRSLGFSPGPIDGVAGPLTVLAIKRYQQSKGRPQTASVDDELLKQLREDQAR
jgi:hypothetical protein